MLLRSRVARLAPPAAIAAIAATAVVASLALAAAPAAADEVYLTNGKSFAGVVAEVEGEKVRIRLPYGGEITLSMSRVDRIERSEAPFERFLARKKALRARTDAGAAEWVELAKWARAEGFEHGAREAALTAARIDPRSPAVAPLMREMGYVLDDRLGEWVTRDEAMERSGLVRHRGIWVTPEERESQLREEEERARRRAERAERERLDRLTRTVEAVAQLELARTLAEPRQPAGVYYPTVVWPGYFVVATPVPVPPAIAPPPGGTPEPPLPGPFRPAEHHHGGFDSSFGGGLGSPDLIPGRLNPDAAPPPGRIVSTRR